METKLLVWGANSHGQLGVGFCCEAITEPVFLNSSRVKSLPPLRDIKSIRGGGGYTLILTDRGLVYGCGLNGAGQLGIKDSPVLDFVKLPNLDGYKIVQLDAGWETCFAVTEDGLCIGWGSNSYGQLGQSIDKFKSIRQPVVLANNVAQVKCGARHCVILLKNGTVLTYGDSRSGKLGRPVNESSNFIVPGLENIKSISCGFNHSIALSHDGNVYGWGCNKWGQLAIDPKDKRLILEPEVIFSDESLGIISIQAGWSSTHIHTDRCTVINCGRNHYGQLGTPDRDSLKAWNFHSLNNVYKLSVGSEHALGLRDDGRLISWGWNEHGSCGNGNTENQAVPCEVLMRDSLRVHYLFAGVGHNYALVQE